MKMLEILHLPVPLLYIIHMQLDVVILAMELDIHSIGDIQTSQYPEIPLVNMTS